MTTEPTTDPGLSLAVDHYFTAPPEAVFDAYTDAEKQRIWFSILDDTPGIVRIDVDLCVGGVQTAAWGADADSLFRETQTFLEIDRPHRLVTESTGVMPDGTSMTTRVEVSFAANGSGTVMTVRQSGFSTEGVRDFFAESAWDGAFARLDAFLERSA
ncbi:MAG: hypothetical protein RI885_1913 [Actinomycetota bacterium]|jgi:uncharacterized protein YndB with AHSA1/START domain